MPIRVGGVLFNDTDQPVVVRDALGVRIVWHYINDCDLPRYTMIDALAPSRCASCEREFSMWMCDDDLWLRLPEEKRGLHLCPQCYWAAVTS